MEVKREGNVLVLRVEAAIGTKAQLALGLKGTAAETDEDLMHEDPAYTASIPRATWIESSTGRRKRRRQPAKPSPFMETGYRSFAPRRIFLGKPVQNSGDKEW